MSRVDTPHDVPQTYCERLVAGLEPDLERLGEVLAEVVGGARPAAPGRPPSAPRSSRCGRRRRTSRSPTCGRRRRAWPARSRRTPCRAPGSCSVSSSASSAVSCAVCPSCQRNSVVRRNSRVTFSQRTTLAHWLISTGRSRHDWIHFAYIVPMMTSEVGRIASGSSSSSVPPLRDPRHLRREALDVLRLLHQQALGDEQREVRVHVAGRLEAIVERRAGSAPRWRSRTGRITMQPLTGE